MMRSRELYGHEFGHGVTMRKTALTVVGVCLVHLLLMNGALAAPIAASAHTQQEEDAREIDKRRETTNEILKLEGALKKSAGENKQFFPSKVDVEAEMEQPLQVDALESDEDTGKRSANTDRVASERAGDSDDESAEKILDELLARTKPHDNSYTLDSQMSADETGEEEGDEEETGRYESEQGDGDWPANQYWDDVQSNYYDNPSDSRQSSSEPKDGAYDHQQSQSQSSGGQSDHSNENAKIVPANSKASNSGNNDVTAEKTNNQSASNTNVVVVAKKNLPPMFGIESM